MCLQEPSTEREGGGREEGKDEKRKVVHINYSLSLVDRSVVYLDSKYVISPEQLCCHWCDSPST